MTRDAIRLHRVVRTFGSGDATVTALHDLTLSSEPVRKLVFDQLDRWLTAYVERS